jgi:Na+/H+ antiporter NhaD/arsenite permease-like protein
MASREMLGLVDWQMLALFAGLFVVNRSFEDAGMMQQLLAAISGAGIDPAHPGWLYCLTALLSNVVSNVPAVMLLLPAVQGAAATGALAIHSGGAILALSSTLAGNLLLVGSIANLIVAEQARQAGVRIDWRDHARIGLPVAAITLLIGWVWLALFALAR